MTRIALVAGGDKSLLARDFDFYVGVDAGSLVLLEQGLPMDLVVGDFDSVSREKLQEIQAGAKEMIQTIPEKDDTDMDFALKQVFQRFPDAYVTIYGAFGGRLDHALSNIFLPTNPDLKPYLRQLELRDEQNIIRYYESGWQTVYPEAGMTYVAFMAEGDSDLQIEGAKYPLDSSNFFLRKVYTSNEFIGEEPIRFKVNHGYVVVFYCRDRR